VACVPVPDGRGGRVQELRTFPSFTSGLEALAGRRAAEGVTQVVVEATGQQREAPLLQHLPDGLPAAAGQRPPRQDPARPQDRRVRRRLAGRGCWSVGCCAAASCPQPPSGSGAAWPAAASGPVPGPRRRGPARPEDPGGRRHQAGPGRHRRARALGSGDAGGPGRRGARPPGAGRAGQGQVAGQAPPAPPWRCGAGSVATVRSLSAWPWRT
jgi:hypothetical protein